MNGSKEQDICNDMIKPSIIFQICLSFGRTSRTCPWTKYSEDLTIYDTTRGIIKTVKLLLSVRKWQHNGWFSQCFIYKLLTENYHSFLKSGGRHFQQNVTNCTMILEAKINIVLDILIQVITCNFLTTIAMTSLSLSLTVLIENAVFKLSKIF